MKPKKFILGSLLILALFTAVYSIPDHSPKKELSTIRCEFISDFESKEQKWQYEDYLMLDIDDQNKELYDSSGRVILSNYRKDAIMFNDKEIFLVYFLSKDEWGVESTITIDRVEGSFYRREVHIMHGAGTKSFYSRTDSGRCQKIEGAIF